MDRLKKVIVITGGGSGIGRALCLRYAAKGHVVAALDRNLGGAEETAGLAAPGEVFAGELDVTDREAFAAAIANIEARHGPVDMLVNNAGIGVGGEIRDHTYEDFRQVYAVNLMGTLHGVMAVYPQMIARRSGTIVNIGSVAGLFPLPGQAAYSSSKYAVVGLTRILAAESRGLGVRTVLVCPGKIETPIYATSSIRGFDKEKALALWPAGITPEECARIIEAGIDRGNSTIVITKLAKVLYLLNRLMPDLIDRLNHFYMQRMRRVRLD